MDAAGLMEMKRNKKSPGGKRSGRGEGGIALVEALVAIAILGGGVLTLILAMSGGALAVRENDREVVAQGLARTQLEYIKNCPFDPGATDYPVVDAPTGYGITVVVTPVPGAGDDIQKVTASIDRDGDVVMTVEDYKVNR
jgi:type II secretory pathway pseudopilin PulG